MGHVSMLFVGFRVHALSSLLSYLFCYQYQCYCLPG